MHFGLGHSLNPKYCNDEWLNGGPSHKFPPHVDRVTLEKVVEGYIEFSTCTGSFGGYDVIKDIGIKKPYAWWAIHRATCTILQQLAMLHQVFGAWRCRSRQTHLGDMWRQPPNFREHHGGQGDTRSLA
jgi:hypothetical protein